MGEVGRLERQWILNYLTREFKRLGLPTIVEGANVSTRTHRYNVKRNGVTHCSSDELRYLCEDCRREVQSCTCQQCNEARERVKRDIVAASHELGALNHRQLSDLAKDLVVSEIVRNHGVPPPPSMLPQQPTTPRQLNANGVPSAPSILDRIRLAASRSGR
jgi:hypothetical protein